MKPQFAASLRQYKDLVEQEIDAYIAKTRLDVEGGYGADAAAVTSAFLEILGRDGKRLRGALVLVGYELAGGTNQSAARQLALVLEMVHAYILMIDDIQDRSILRRGGPTAHVALAEAYGKAQSQTEAAHTGIALALNAALFGAHSAQVLLTNLDAPTDTRLHLIALINKAMMATAHGQTYDLVNGLKDGVTEADIESVMRLKSCEYTVMNPLAAGMTLGQASEDELALIHDYALPTGLAFQLGDDIIGIFSTEAETGKSPKSDIEEGKMTVLVTEALARASAEDHQFLQQILGQPDLTDGDLAKCRQIIEGSGALEYARQKLKRYAAEAVAVLDQAPSGWPQTQVDFLKDIAQYMANRATSA